MRHNPLITVAIPIYNAEDYLRAAIKSSLSQTYNNIEVLLINDGSTDNSLAIMESFSNDARVQIIDDGDNKGLIYRLNQSVDLAKGEFYARMDADDIMHPERIEQQLTFLLNNPNVDVVGTSIYSIDIENRVRGKRVLKQDPNKNFTARRCFVHPSVMGRVEWFRKNRYSHKFIRMEDCELWERTASTSTFYNLQTPLLFYREVGIPTYPKVRKSYIPVIKKVYHSKYSVRTKIVRITLVTFKLCVRWFIYILKKEDLLILRRSIRISKEESDMAEQVINKIIG